MSMNDVFAQPYRVRSLGDIDPELFYLRSWVTAIRIPGVDLVQLLREAERGGGVCAALYRMQNGGKLYTGILGADIIKLATDAELEHKRRQERIRERVAAMSPDEVAQCIEKHRQDRNRLVQLRGIQQKLERAEEENALLKQRLVKREATEAAQLELNAQRVVAYLFDGSHVQHVSNEWLENLCGIYVLLRDDVPVYVGQSVNIPQRIATHRKEKAGLFDSVRFFPCPKEDLNDKELFIIRLLKPELNGNYKHSGTAKPASPMLTQLGAAQ